MFSLIDNFLYTGENDLRLVENIELFTLNTIMLRLWPVKIGVFLLYSFGIPGIISASFIDFSCRPELPYAIQDVSFDVNAGEKVCFFLYF